MIALPIWLPATLFAGALQAWRTAVQRRVGKALTVNAAGLVRYLYGLPFALALAGTYQFVVAPQPLPHLTLWFFVFATAGGVAQIIATNLLLMAFEERNFVVGTAYSKTEAMQSALLSVLLLGDRLAPLVWLGIASGVAGVMILSTGGKRMGPGALLRSLGQRAAIYGIASGLFFALTTIGVRRATMELGTGDDHVRAGLLTLAVVVALQTVLQGGYVWWRERDQVPLVFANWRVAGQVGLMSSLGSACWFTAFASAPVALVRIVGQVEIAFTMAVGHFYLGERMRASEAVGLLLVGIGVVLALAGAL
ncbi:DMT family transporter [Sphingomonas hylomeconis]|uniref:EamA family transporter n=1 Tax=Sphingomonas hylomeconis TaxID=1395958 RepID=A0ABV7SSR7_9SPHN|nr:DMT family transporter [Sphingomonas hylomeconis]